MPFCKRTILPKDVCKPDGRKVLEARPQQQAEIFGDLVDVCGFTLCSVLRQLSDLSQHSVSILEELEEELVSICHRSGALESRVVRLQRHVAVLLSKPPPRTTSGLEAESGRRGGSSSNSSHGDGNHSSSGGAAHFRSPWQQSVNVFGSWSRPDCVEELHQQAQLNLQSLLQVPCSHVAELHSVKPGCYLKHGSTTVCLRSLSALMLLLAGLRFYRSVCRL